MSVLVILLVCACNVWAAPSNVNITQNNVKQSSIFEPHIVGGNPSDILPYQVSLRKKRDFIIPVFPTKYNHFCGGAVISKNLVLTAAHCFQEANENLVAQGIIYAVIGTRKMNFDPKTTFLTKVEALMKHAFYDQNKMSDDIAVLKLENPIPIENQNIHPIPMKTAATAAGEKCKISGWGYTSYDTPVIPELLQSAIVPIVDTDTCSQAYSTVGFLDKLGPDMMCAGGEDEGRDTCQGDSGGPLVCNGELAGIASWGYRCGVPGIPGVYSSVAHHRDFIVGAMKAFGEDPPPATAPAPTTAPATVQPQPSSARKLAFGILSNIIVLLAAATTGMSLKVYL